MSYKRHMLEGPHPLAGILIFLPADIQFGAIEWVRETESKPAKKSRAATNNRKRRKNRQKKSSKQACYER